MRAAPWPVTLIVGTVFTLGSSYGLIFKTREWLAFIPGNQSEWVAIAPADWIQHQSSVQKIDNGPRHVSQKQISIGTLRDQETMIIADAGKTIFDGWIKASDQDVENINGGPYSVRAVYVYTQNPILELTLQVLGLLILGLVGWRLARSAAKKLVAKRNP